MGVQGMFPLTHWCSCTLTSVEGMFSTHSKVFTCTHKHSGRVQYWLKGIHAHSQAFRGCSILTQRHSCALTNVQGVLSSDTNEIFLMVTAWWVAFNNDSMAFMRTQWEFTLTQWHSCALNECSGGVQYSLIGIHVHSMGVQGMFPLTHWHSCKLNGCSGAVHTHSLAFTRTHKCSGSVQYVFSLFMYLKAQWYVFKFANAKAL
jgi:hypothetical protein